MWCGPLLYLGAKNEVKVVVSNTGIHRGFQLCVQHRNTSWISTMWRAENEVKVVVSKMGIHCGFQRFQMYFGLQSHEMKNDLLRQRNGVHHMEVVIFGFLGVLLIW